MIEAVPTQRTSTSVPWWKLLNGYHWAVFTLAAFGWVFDCFDQQIFVWSRSITMHDLLRQADDATQFSRGNWATSLFILGWATGGILFGVIGDRWGRAKTMALTILIYALCTGLSGFAHSWAFFAFFRFLTGAGVGGEFAVGAALIAEVMPERVRPHALGALQALTTVGNILAAVALGVVVPAEKLGWGWRGLYYLGALPGIIAVVVFWRLKEPEKWASAKAKAADSGRRFGDLAALFIQPLWRRHALVGLGLAAAGQIGLWGVAFYTPELIDSAIPSVESRLRPKLETILNAASPEAHAAAVSALDAQEQQKYRGLLARIAGHARGTRPAAVLAVPLTPTQKAQFQSLLNKAVSEDEKTRLKSRAGYLQQIGAFLGIFSFTLMTAFLGRRLSFLIALLLAWGSLFLAFATFHEPKQILYLWPILGFGTLAPFGGYAIYLPELFPTRLRATGTSFCYNAGRYITAFGVLILSPLSKALEGVAGLPGFRVAAIVLAASYLAGIIALIWAPETVNQPLREEA